MMLRIQNCRERQKRLLHEMEARGLSLVVLGNPRTIYYFSGALVEPSLPQVFALNASGKSLLVTNQEPRQSAAESGHGLVRLWSLAIPSDLWSKSIVISKYG